MTLTNQLLNPDRGKAFIYCAREVVTTVVPDIASFFIYQTLPLSVQKVASTAFLALNGLRHVKRSGILGRIKRGVNRFFGRSQEPVQKEESVSLQIWRWTEGALGVAELALASYTTIHAIRSLFIKKSFNVSHTLNHLTFENGSPLDRCTLEGTSSKTPLKTALVFNQQPVCLDQCKATPHHLYHYTHPKSDKDLCSLLLMKCNNRFDAKGKVIESCTRIYDYEVRDRNWPFSYLEKLRVKLQEYTEDLFSSKIHWDISCQTNGACSVYDHVSKQTTQLQLPLAPHQSITGIQGSVFIPAGICWGSSHPTDLWERCSWIEPPITQSSFNRIFSDLSWQEIGKDKCQLTGVSFYGNDEKLVESCQVINGKSSSLILRCYQWGVNHFYTAGQWAKRRLEESSQSSK